MKVTNQTISHQSPITSINQQPKPFPTYCWTLIPSYVPFAIEIKRIQLVYKPLPQFADIKLLLPSLLKMCIYLTTLNTVMMFTWP